MWLIYFIIYWISISAIAYYYQTPLPDVIKEMKTWVYNKDFEKGDIVSMPIECFNEITKRLDYE